MSMTIECSWEEFKQMAKEFHLAAPTLNIEELNNAWKCLGLGYIGMKESMWQSSAVVVMRMEMETFVARKVELM